MNTKEKKKTQYIIFSKWEAYWTQIKQEKVKILLYILHDDDIMMPVG